MRAFRASAIWAKLRGFGRPCLDQRGSVMPLVALACFVLIGSAGLAVDGTRLMLMHSKLQTAIDAAGLSTVARLNTTDIPGEVGKFARANFLDGYVGAQILSITPTMSDDQQTLTVAATASTATTFMNIFGISTMTTSAETNVTKAMGGLELAMVLDVTGSMADDEKITSLKSAANSLLDILFGADAVANKLYIGIVPFSQAVNIGTSRTAWLTSTPSKWGGCVEARFNGRDINDDPPSLEKFNPYSGTCPPAVTPMTSTKATLVSAISGLTPNGYTHIALGLDWGWNMLSPRWQGLWGGTMGTTLPLKYGATGMSKAVILMTDGENTMVDGTAYGSIDCSGSKSVTCAYDSRLNVSATSTSESKATSAANSAGEAALDAKLTAVCTQMKNAGITIYTVALGDPGTAIEARLKACASQSAFYFDTPTGAELQTAFAEIGDSLSSLRVSR